MLFFFLTYYGKGAHYPELADGQAEFFNVSVSTKLALKWKAIRLCFILLNQFFQTVRETKYY